MLRYKLIAVITTILLILGLNLGALARTYTISCITSPSSSWARGAEKFAELVEAGTGGKIMIKVHPNAKLANSNQKTELEMTQMGNIDMQLVSPIILALFMDQRFDVFGLPWMFPSHEIANEVCDGEMGDLAYEWLAAKGLVGLAFGANGFRQVTNSVREIRTPADMKGIKFRVAGSQMFLKTFRYLDAGAQTMNFGEVFTSLQQGVIDGQENPLSIIYSAKLYEVQEYCTIWNYAYDPIILVVNQDVWNSFSEADQEILRDAARKAMDYERKLVAEEYEEMPKILERSGMKVTILDKEEMQAFKDAIVDKVYSEHESVIGKDLIERCKREVKKAKLLIETVDGPIE